MPRKPLLYTDQLPYHIFARTNNREWFKGELNQVWKIYKDELCKLNQKYSFTVHAFVLMSNHYHLIASCHKDYDLGFIMRLLQNRTAIRINKLSGRINHCYGGRYKAALITNQNYYAAAMKYLYRNPVEAGMVANVEDWPYTRGSLKTYHNQNEIPVACHHFQRALSLFEKNPLLWLNQNFRPGEYVKLQKAAKKTVFKMSKTNVSKLYPW